MESIDRSIGILDVIDRIDRIIRSMDVPIDAIIRSIDAPIDAIIRSIDAPIDAIGFDGDVARERRVSFAERFEPTRAINLSLIHI